MRGWSQHDTIVAALKMHSQRHPMLSAVFQVHSVPLLMPRSVPVFTEQASLICLCCPFWYPNQSSLKHSFAGLLAVACTVTPQCSTPPKGTGHVCVSRLVVGVLPQEGRYLCWKLFSCLFRVKSTVCVFVSLDQYIWQKGSVGVDLKQ